MKKEDPIGEYVMGGLHIVCLMEMLFDIIKKYVPTHIQESLKGLHYLIAS
jgi:hypothetical protein